MFLFIFAMIPITLNEKFYVRNKYQVKNKQITYDIIIINKWEINKVTTL